MIRLTQTLPHALPDNLLNLLGLLTVRLFPTNKCVNITLKQTETNLGNFHIAHYLPWIAQCPYRTHTMYLESNTKQRTIIVNSCNLCVPSRGSSSGYRPRPLLRSPRSDR